LRKDEKPDLDGMVGRVVDGSRFLADLTELNKHLPRTARKRTARKPRRSSTAKG